MEDRNYTVYMHVNKSNGKKYVGITSMKTSERWRSGKGYKTQVFFHAIKKYGWDNFTHMIIGENFSKEEAEKEEKYLIYIHKTTDASFGYNMEGGGNANKKASPETREKMSANHADVKGLNNPMYGKACSDKVKNASSLKNSGRFQGEKSSRAILDWEKVNTIRKLYCNGGYTQIEIAKQFNVGRSTISLILTNRRWKQQTAN